jgi:large subunit ribosomal protein L15
MRLHDLKPAPGSHRDRKRLGRGNASGQGTTAGKGTKGEKARSGGMKAGFRGMSSRNQRMAKRRGFTNRFKVEYHAINVGDLASLDAGSTVTIDSLRAAGFIKGKDTLPKLLGDGDLGVALHVVDLKVSRAAREKIEAAGGSVSALESDTEPTSPTTNRVTAPTATSSGAEAEPTAAVPGAPIAETPEPATGASTEDETSG